MNIFKISRCYSYFISPVQRVTLQRRIQLAESTEQKQRLETELQDLIQEETDIKNTVSNKVMYIQYIEKI